MSDHKPVSAMFLITRATKREKQKLRKKLSSNSNTFRFRSLSSQASIGDMKAALEGERKNSTTTETSPSSRKKEVGGGCPLCHKNMLMFRLRSKQCDSCKKRYCSKCCPKDNRGNITNDEGDVLKRNARFCLQCKPMNLVFM